MPASRPLLLLLALFVGQPAAPAGASPAAPAPPSEPARLLVERVIDAAALTLGPGVTIRIDGVHVPALTCSPSRAELLAPLSTSQRVGVRLLGDAGAEPACTAFGSADVRIFEERAVIAAAVAAGNPLASALRWEVVERRASEPPGVTRDALPAGARARRALSPGAPLRLVDLSRALPPGTAVTVVAQAGAVRVEQSGHAAACPSAVASEGVVCAVLRNGARVSGELDEAGMLVVGLPGRRTP